MGCRHACCWCRGSKMAQQACMPRRAVCNCHTTSPTAFNACSAVCRREEPERDDRRRQRECGVELLPRQVRHDGQRQREAEHEQRVSAVHQHRGWVQGARDAVAGWVSRYDRRAAGGPWEQFDLAGWALARCAPPSAHDCPAHWAATPTAAGFPVTAMRKRKEEPPPQRPNPRFDPELSPQVRCWGGMWWAEFGSVKPAVSWRLCLATALPNICSAPQLCGRPQAQLLLRPLPPPSSLRCWSSLRPAASAPTRWPATAWHRSRWRLRADPPPSPSPTTGA